MPDIREQLRHCFQGRVCVIGIGNVDFGDDGFGVVLAQAIAARLSVSGHVSLARSVIIAGTTPERMIGSMAGKGFDHLIFLDAVEFGGEPGSVTFLDAQEIVARFPQISTHKISIGLLARCITAGGGTCVWLLGVQPGSLKPMQGLSSAVQRTKDILEEMLCDVWVSMKDVGDINFVMPDLIRHPEGFEAAGFPHSRE
jgi:hydrogenase maturation protease